MYIILARSVGILHLTSSIVFILLFGCMHILGHAAVATHPSILAWKIPWTEKPGRL